MIYDSAIVDKITLYILAAAPLGRRPFLGCKLGSLRLSLPVGLASVLRAIFSQADSLALSS